MSCSPLTCYLVSGSLPSHCSCSNLSRSMVLFLFVRRTLAHCDPSCLCLVLSRARCFCRCLFVLVVVPFVWLFAMLFLLTFPSRVLLHLCFLLSACTLVCALPFRFPLCRCCSATSVHCRYCAHDCAALCSLRARVMPLCDSMALPSNTNSSILMRCCAGRKSSFAAYRACCATSVRRLACFTHAIHYRL